MTLSETADVFSISYKTKKTIQQKLGMSLENALVRVIDRGIKELRDSRFIT